MSLENGRPSFVAGEVRPRSAAKRKRAQSTPPAFPEKKRETPARSRKPVAYLHLANAPGRERIPGIRIGVSRKYFPEEFAFLPDVEVDSGEESENAEKV